MRLLNNIRYAGKRLREFDDAYAGKIMDMYAPAATRAEKQGNTALQSAIIGASILGGGLPARKIPVGKSAGQPKWAEAMQEPVAYAIPAVSTAVRYGAPAAGVALAGKGIYDLATRGQSQPSDNEKDLP